MPAGLDLSCLKLAGIGADLIQAPVLQRFADIFAPVGFDARAFMPSYGMAELCVGLSFGPRFGGFRIDTVGKRDFVSCGRPMAGHRVEIRDESGAPLPDGQVGRLFVEGPSVMPGYIDEPEATARVLKNGWLDTGDLGYWLNGEIVVTGRAKDLIIINGRNVWPQDIEWAIEAKRIVKNGDAAAFSIDTGEGERVVVAVLARVSGEEARVALARDVAGAVREAIAVDCDVALVPPTTGLPTTSSGKLSRARTKANYLAGLYTYKPAAA